MKKFLFLILKLQLITILFNLLILVIYLPIHMIFGEHGIGWVVFYIVQLVLMILFFRIIGKLLFKNYNNKIFLINFILSMIFSEIMTALVVYNSKVGGWIPMSISNSFFTFIDYPIFTVFDTTLEIVFFRMSLCYILEDIIRYLCLISGRKTENKFYGLKNNSNGIEE